MFCSSYRYTHINTLFRANHIVSVRNAHTKGMLLGHTVPLLVSSGEEQREILLLGLLSAVVRVQSDTATMSDDELITKPIAATTFSGSRHKTALQYQMRTSPSELKEFRVRVQYRGVNSGSDALLLIENCGEKCYQAL